jgi:aminomethyltransferase
MTTPDMPAAESLKKTALNSTHRVLKAKMVDFGGWDMPVEYPSAGGGVIAEHLAVPTWARFSFAAPAHWPPSSRSR